MKTAHSHYCDSSDFTLASELIGLAPTEARAFLNFKEAAERTNGVIPAKYRELISIAVALTTQCPYCLDVHTKKAKQHDATREEFAEAAFIAAAMRAGAALGHGMMALRLFDRDLESRD
jgi:AhpD family alkylhydroperoxidase